jgi:hypothetical protein
VFSLGSDTKSVRKTSSGACNKRQKHQKGQKRRRNPVILAREWQKAIEEGEYKSQSDLARKKGISRARVTQVLNVLKLDAEVQETVVKLGDPMPPDSMTERALRGMAGLSGTEQVRNLERILPNP